MDQRLFARFVHGAIACPCIHEGGETTKESGDSASWFSVARRGTLMNDLPTM